MSLLPAKAFDPRYAGSIDAAILDHVGALRIGLGDEELRVIRNICINVRRLRGLDSRAARARSKSLAEIRGNRALYSMLMDRQGQRCLWCGVDLRAANVMQTLEHFAPKHLGDDLTDASNWALSCASCNNGKGAVLAWSASGSAHDFLMRAGFENPDRVGLDGRWAVLVRARRCEFCGIEPLRAELWVFRRVKTGLPIPANCSATCGPCAKARGSEILQPQWLPEEAGQTLPA
jgi:hypothetical protein